MDFIGNTTPQILKDQASEQKGEIARLQSFVGAIAVSDLVKSTLGPKGLDKILKPIGAGPKADYINVTNDGATILRSMHVDNPAARILIDISKSQDEEIGDGTTTVAVLAGELLRKAEELMMMKIHPQTIISGYQKARNAAQETLIAHSFDNSTNEQKFREELLNIAKTTLSSKLVTQDKDNFANLAVDAVLRLKGSGNLDYIKIIKVQGSSIKDSFLDEGFLIEKNITVGCPKFMDKCNILVANTPMDYDKIKMYGAKVKVESMDQVAEIEAEEKLKMKDKIDRILAYKPNVFINRQLIYNYPEQLLAEKGILVIEHADFDGMERIAAATGSEILSTFNNPERAGDILGYCERIEEILIGEQKFIKFKGCKKGEACTIVLRGSSSHILDESERSVHDALCVLIKTIQNKRVIYGGGNSEIIMAEAVEELSKKTKGKQGLAIEYFAKALRTLPSIIADNGGYDAPQLVQELKVEIKNGNLKAGLNMTNGTIGNMEELGIRECLRSKEQALISASEAAEMILRVDNIIRCAPRERTK